MYADESDIELAGDEWSKENDTSGIKANSKKRKKAENPTLQWSRYKGSGPEPPRRSGSARV